MRDIFKKDYFFLFYSDRVVVISSVILRFTHPVTIEYNYFQHQFASSRYYRGKCRYCCYYCLLLFLSMAHISPDRQPLLYSSLSHQAANTLTRIHLFILILLHTHSHLPESRTRTEKREKLTPYVRFQPVCRPSLREASDRMIIAVRVFAC
jgi:hypothetical protein